MSDNAEVDADIRIRMAIPNWNRTSLVDFDLFTAAKSFSWESGRLVGGRLVGGQLIREVDDRKVDEC